MIRKEKNGLIWFEFELLQNYPHVIHGVFAHNQGLSSEDVKKIINNNCSVPCVFAKQIHKTNLYNIENRPDGDVSVLDVDILATGCKDVLMMIRHADCQAGIMYDTKNDVLLLVHAGWRGQMQNIYQKAIHFLCRTYNSQVDDILVLISPSLGPQHSEFINYKTEILSEFHKYRKENNHFDLWQIAFDQLRMCGILEKNIEIAMICTFSHPNLFHSYRRDKTTKRNCTFGILT